MANVLMVLKVLEAIVLVISVIKSLLIACVAGIVIVFFLTYPLRGVRAYHVASESGKVTVSHASKVFGAFCEDWAEEVTGWWKGITAEGSGATLDAIMTRWYAMGRVSVLTPTYIGLNMGRPEAADPRPGFPTPKPRDEKGSPFDPVADVYDYPGRRVDVKSLVGLCFSDKDGQGAYLESRATEYPGLGFLSPDEVDVCFRTWAFRNPKEDGFDPVKIIGFDADDVGSLKRIEKFDLLLAVLPEFSEHVRKDHGLFKYVKYYDVPEAVAWVKGSPRSERQNVADSGRPAWDPLKDLSLRHDLSEEIVGASEGKMKLVDEKGSVIARRDLCTAPWIALKLAFHRRQRTAMETAAGWIESSRDDVGKSLRSRVHEAVSNSAHLVKALLDVGMRGGRCIDEGNGDFPGPDRLFEVIRGNAREYSRTRLAPAAEAFRRWAILESGATAMATEIRSAAAIAGGGGPVPLSDQALSDFTARSLAMFDDCMTSMCTAIASATLAGDISPPASALDESASWNRMLDLITPDPGVEGGYLSLERFAAAHGDLLGAMSEEEAKRDCKRRFKSYLGLLNAVVYSEGYVQEARSNVNRLLTNKFVAEKFWCIFFNDISRAYITKTRPAKSPVVPHVSELGTVYNVESVSEYTTAYWSDWNGLVRSNKKFFSEQMQQTLASCAAIFGWSRTAQNEMADSGFTGAVHPTSFVMLTPQDGTVKRVRLGADGTVTYVTHTQQVVDPDTGEQTTVVDPMRRSDHFVFKELESNVFMLLSNDGLKRAWVSGTSEHILKFDRNTTKISEGLSRFQASMLQMHPVYGKQVRLTVSKRPGYALDVWLRPLSLVRWLIDTDDRKSWRSFEETDPLEKFWRNKIHCHGKTIGNKEYKRTRLSCAQACAADPKCKFATQQSTDDERDKAKCRIKAECGKKGLTPDSGWDTWVKP